MVDLFDYWTKKGWVEPHFIIRRPLKNIVPELKRRGWAYTPLYYTNWSQRNPSKRAEDVFRNATFNTKAVFAIEKLIGKVQPDVIMTNTIVSPWAAIAAYFQGIPHAWFVREYGDIDHKHVFELGREKMLQDVDMLSGLIVTNSKTLARYVKGYVEKTKVTPLYTPFDIPALERKSEQRAPNPFKNPNSLKLVITGKITPSKGQAEAAEAVAKLIERGYEAELCVIGTPKEPKDDDPLRRMISRHKLESRVHLIGEQSNPLAILRQADIGIMASRQEAFGRVTFEYMVTRRPVVGANSGATPELIDDDVNGYLFESGSAQSLYEQLVKYARDKDLITKHGEAARRKAERMMQGEHNAEALFDKVQALALQKPLVRPLNFAHRWLEYPGIAQQYIEDSKAISIKRIFYLRLRQHGKIWYLRLTGLFGKNEIGR